MWVPGRSSVLCGGDGSTGECSDGGDGEGQGTSERARSGERGGTPSSIGDRIGEQRVMGSVDYNKGRRRLSVQVDGVGRDRLPARYRLRAAGSVDWTVTEVAERILRLEHWNDIEGILNRWAGRFARKNFPLLIRVMKLLRCFLSEHSLLHSLIFGPSNLWIVVGVQTGKCIIGVYISCFHSTASSSGQLAIHSLDFFMMCTR